MAKEGDDTRDECHSMLIELKSTVEGLLGNHTTNVWNTYGGLSRLTSIVNKILKHRLKPDQNHPNDCWNFILGLRVLMPTSAPWLERHRLATEGYLDRSYLWLQQRLQEHTLSSYLKVLLDDSNHVMSCYQVGAVLRQDGHGDFLLTCLNAVENNQLSILTELDPNLLVDRIVPSQPRSHARRLSLPCSIPEISLQFHSPMDKRYGAASRYPFTSKDGGIRTKGTGQLHRTHPVDPSRATYHRERCCTRRRLKSEFERTGAIPKSVTWDNISLSDPSLRIAVDKHRNGQKFRGQTSGIKQLSESCMCLYASTSRGSRSENLPDKFQRAMSSMPCISNTNRTASRSIEPVKDPSEFSQDNSSGQNKVSYESHPEMGSRCKSHTMLPFGPVTQCEMQIAADVKSKTVIGSSVSVVPPIKVDLPLVHRSPSHSRSKSDVGIGHSVHSSGANRETGGTFKSQLSSAVSLSASLPANLQNETQSKASFDEESSTPIFMRPVEGQSLTSFLSSQDFRTCTDLDKENAHFSISEALIAAIEQIKCNQMLKIAEEEDEESDDEEIKHLKQRIRIRRRERLQEKVAFRSPHLLSDGYTDTATTTTSQTPSPRSTSSDNKSDESSDSVDPIDLSDSSEVDSKLGQLNESGLSLSMASLYSDADIHRPAEVVQSCTAVQDLSDKRADIKLMENFQARVTKIPHSMMQHSYENKCKIWGIEKLEDRRVRGDCIEQFKLPNGVDQMGWLQPLTLISEMMGHDSHHIPELVRSCNQRFHFFFKQGYKSLEQTFHMNGSLTESLSSYGTAEAVALNLLKKFSEKQLPKASDLEWLVSSPFEEVPQKLLPLPNSWPVSPDDAENAKNPIPTRLRGNFEWAPPRQQIIFNVHPTPQRRVIMAKQNYRCAGCGAKVEQGFVKRFRYCEYLGKYFCQCCHNNSLSYIPGHILRKWDFNKYYVSNFSRDLLKKMAYEPLYNITDINQTLYRRVKALNQVLQLRLQLVHLKDFVRVCRKCECLAQEFEKQPNYLYTNPHLYSLHDLVQVKTGDMLNKLHPLVKQARLHIDKCELCQAKGFFCEFCKNDEVIFSYQLDRVTQCQICWSCYHSNCFIPEQCPKCLRIKARKKLLQKEDGQYQV